MKRDLCYNVSFGKPFHLNNSDCSHCKECDCRSEKYFTMRVDGSASEPLTPDGYTSSLSRRFVGEISGICIDTKSVEDIDFVSKKLGVMENDALYHITSSYSLNKGYLVIADCYFDTTNSNDLSCLFLNLRDMLYSSLNKNVAVYLALNEVEMSFVKKNIKDFNNFEIIENEQHRALFYK